MLSCWFEVSCRWLVSSVCSQGGLCMKSLIHTFSHFVETLLTKPPSNSRTFAKLLCVVSSLSEHVLLPIIVQSLSLPPRKSALCNLRIVWTDCDPKQRRRFSTSHLNLCFPQAKPSSLHLVNRRVWANSDTGPHSSKKLRRICQACPPLLTKEIT